MPLTDLVVADTPEALVDALAKLETLDCVGVDVERADWDRYYRAAALIQVGGEGRVAVIDPLQLADLSALDQFLAPRLVVLHALENDLEPLASLGVNPTTVADTAIAAAILGLPTGLETLLRDVLDIELSVNKAAMQRADWEARPLTSEMLEYAAGDVADLPQLWGVLSARLDEAGRTSWYEQELSTLLSQPSAPDRRDWTRTKGAGRLDAAGRARLRRVWLAREDLARTTDTAPGRIASDGVLIDLAGDPPTSPRQLTRRGLRRQAVRDFGAALVEALNGTDVTAPDNPRRQRPVTDADRVAADKLRTVRAERAAEIGIDPGVLCPSRTLMTALLTDPQTPEDLRDALGLRAWQWEVLGEAFSEALPLPHTGVQVESAPRGRTASGNADPGEIDG